MNSINRKTGLSVAGASEVPAALAANAIELLGAAVRAHSTLAAAAKIVRGSSHPKTADIIAAQAAELMDVIRRASSEVPR